MPGPDSFTSALIWALERLVKDRVAFSTLELQSKIVQAPKFPEGQIPHLCERDEPCARRLVLAPLPKSTENRSDAEFANADDRHEETENEFLDLRFFYKRRPDVEELTGLANGLKGLIEDEKIKAYRVGWIDLSGLKRARVAAQKWRRVASLSSPIKSPMATSVPKLVLPQGVCPSMQTPPGSISGQSENYETAGGDPSYMLGQPHRFLDEALETSIPDQFIVKSRETYEDNGRASPELHLHLDITTQKPEPMIEDESWTESDRQHKRRKLTVE
jgi:hypothetical protein